LPALWGKLFTAFPPSDIVPHRVKIKNPMNAMDTRPPRPAERDGQAKNPTDTINVSEIVQLIEITAFLMEHVSCSPDGIMEWWNIGMLI
jgi:hypothetical protein